MAVFRIHCVTRLGKNATSTDRMDAVSPSFFRELEKLFNDVCRYDTAKPYTKASAYHWTDRPLHHAPHEPIIWLLDKHSDSLITVVYRKRIPSRYTGANMPGAQGNISEIYLDHEANSHYVAQAKMAFHELMHNKLQMGNEMHGKTFGLGSEMLNLSSAISARLTQEDKSMMAPALKKHIRQYVTPFSDNT